MECPATSLAFVAIARRHPTACRPAVLVRMTCPPVEAQDLTAVYGLMAFLAGLIVGGMVASRAGQKP